MKQSEDPELFGDPLSLDHLPQTLDFCSKIGGCAPQLFATQQRFFQLRLESALATLSKCIPLESIASHFRARLRKDNQGNNVLGIVGEIVASSIYLKTVGQVGLAREGNTKGVDFVGEHTDYETQNEVKFYWDNFGNPPEHSWKIGTEITWPSSVRNLTSSRDAYEKIRIENSMREPDRQVNLGHSRASELFDRLVKDALPKFKEDQINILWVYSQNTNRPYGVAAELGNAILTTIDQGSESAKNLSAFVWYTLSEVSPVLYFWENPPARVQVPSDVAEPLRREAESLQAEIRKEEERKLLEYAEERKEWYAGRKRGERTKFT